MYLTYRILHGLLAHTHCCVSADPYTGMHSYVYVCPGHPDTHSCAHLACSGRLSDPHVHLQALHCMVRRVRASKLLLRTILQHTAPHICILLKRIAACSQAPPRCTSTHPGSHQARKTVLTARSSLRTLASCALVLVSLPRSARTPQCYAYTLQHTTHCPSTHSKRGWCMSQSLADATHTYRAAAWLASWVWCCASRTCYLAMYVCGPACAQPAACFLT